MAASFPTSLPTIQRVAATDRRNAPGKEGHALHNKIADEVEALAAAVGVTGSVVPGTVESRLTEASHLAMHATLRLPDWPTWGTATGQIWKLSADDTIEATCTTSLVITTSSEDWKSGIGRVARPIGAPSRNSDQNIPADAIKEIPWVDDSGYVAGAATVSAIVGGYDHVCNQIAGAVFGGGHNYMQSNSTGHSVIVGGSSNRVAGGRAGIFSATDCTVTSAANSSVVIGGLGNTVRHTYAAVVGGSENVASGDKSLVLGGTGNTSGATAGAIVGGTSNAITEGASSSVIIGGTANAISAAGTYSTTAGRSNTVGHTCAVVFGRDGVSDADNALTIAKTKLSVVGDAQTTLFPMGIRTTNNTLTNLVTALIPPAVKMAIGIRSTVVGIDEATGSSAMYTWDGLAQWDGAGTTTFYDAGGSGATRNFTEIVDNIGCSAVPLWAGNSSLRPKVTGKTATNIKWVATVVCTITRM